MEFEHLMPCRPDDGKANRTPSAWMISLAPLSCPWANRVLSEGHSIHVMRDRCFNKKALDVFRVANDDSGSMPFDVRIVWIVRGIMDGFNFRPLRREGAPDLLAQLALRIDRRMAFQI